MLESCKIVKEIFGDSESTLQKSLRISKRFAYSIYLFDLHMPIFIGLLDVFFLQEANPSHSEAEYENSILLSFYCQSAVRLYIQTLFDFYHQYAGHSMLSGFVIFLTAVC